MRILVILAALAALAIGVTFPASGTTNNHQLEQLRLKHQRVIRLAVKYKRQRDDLQRRLTRRVLELRRAHRHLDATRATLRDLQAAKREPIRRDALYAIRLASATYGVSYTDMLRIAQCESHLNPYAKNRSSTASGLFQWLDSSWAAQGISGFSVWDPVANAMAAARARVRDGSWRQWVCR